jgi:hypothetical protein
MRDSLPTGSMERLLISMYTLIPPRRVDYHSVPLVRNGSPEPSGNFIKVGSDGLTLVMTEYKTSKRYGRQEEVLPEALVEQISASLEQNPREHLFVTPNNKPYSSAKTFVTWANGVLKGVFKKNLSLTLIRHSYLTSLDFSGMTTGDQVRLGRLMGHSVLMQNAYKFVFEDKKTGKPIVKKCVCEE